jgi:polar amino acid transport system substrate-binding protein
VISDGTYKVILDRWGLGMHAVARPMMNAATQ